MRAIGTFALSFALAALSLAAFSTAARAYTPEEQAACQPDAFRLCGSEIPNIERVKACMVARSAELSPECKRFFHADPQPVMVNDPPAGRPVNIRPRPAKPAKHARPVAAKSTKSTASAKHTSTKSASTKPSTKKPAAPKAKKPAKPAAT